MTRRVGVAGVAAMCLLALVAGVVIFRLKQPPPEITQKVGSLVLILQGHPEAANDIDQGTAVKTALSNMSARDLENGATPVNGYRVISAYHALGLVKATTRDGSSAASWSEPKDVWVLEFAAPPQQGWAHVAAFAIIDARSGRVESLSQEKHN